MDAIFDFILLQKPYIEDLDQPKIKTLYTFLFALLYGLCVSLYSALNSPLFRGGTLFIPFIIYATFAGMIHLLFKTVAAYLLGQIFNKNWRIDFASFMKIYPLTFAPAILLLLLNVIGYNYDLNKSVIILLSLLVIVWRIAVQVKFFSLVSDGNLIKNIAIVLISSVSDLLFYLMDFFLLGLVAIMTLF